MAIEPKRVLFLEDRELHMFGDHVAVCWNIANRVEKKSTTELLNGSPQAVTTTRVVHERRGGTKGCYIDFVTIRDPDDDPWLDDDSPVEGGVKPALASKIHTEMGDALAYVDQLLANAGGS